MATWNHYEEQMKFWAKRRAQIRARFAQLKSLTAVAQEFDITKGRVSQIVYPKGKSHAK